MKIEKDLNWYLIEDKFYFTKEEINPANINLMQIRWEDMTYWKNDSIKIEFPWEYDTNWLFIKVYEWDDKLLNYIITNDSKKFAIIQNPKIIETTEIENISNWLYTDESTKNMLDKLELEWNKYLLTEEWVEEILSEASLDIEEY